MVAALSWAARLKAGLSRTRDVLNTPVSELFTRRKVDEALYEELETALLQADCGVAATQALMTSLRKKKAEEVLKRKTPIARMSVVKSVSLLLAGGLRNPFNTARVKPLFRNLSIPC